MQNPFWREPIAIPSMNRVRIVDLPGLDLPESCRGRLAYHLLSKKNLKDMVLAQREVLQLRPDVPDLLRTFDGCFTAVSTPIRTTAEQIAQEYGRYIAYLLLTLKRGDAVNRAARPDWRDVHWDFWGQIELVYVGGGLLAGHLGEAAVAEAAALIHSAGFPSFVFKRSDYAAYLPLLGVARCASAGAAAMLCFDFGQTSVKRAVAFYEQNVLTAIQLLPVLPAPCTTLELNKDPVVAQHTLDAMLAMIADSWLEAAQRTTRLAPHLALSLACYMLNGHPIVGYDWGCYGRLQALTDHVETLLTEQVSTRLQRSVTVQAFHDGAAAAMVYAGAAKTAVLTFGTAIGNGYPPEVSRLRPTSDNLAIS